LDFGIFRKPGALCLNFSPYSWLLLAGIAVSIIVWSRIAKRDERLLLIYVAALVGAFLGAKIVYLLAEGWIDWKQPNRWLRLATGKTIIGGLLGGYVTVELAKKLVGYTSATGDWFALIAPVGIIIGRVGCLLHGCCLGHVCQPTWFTLRDAEGVARWPAVPFEIVFNLVALLAALALRWRKLLPGQHFHLYLIAYGIFRFAHEFVRETPRLVGPLSGYAIAALVTAGWGLFAYVRRAQRTA
jgi:phosphatidylglycerol:prolipoprotein diacylglycerol transferase